MDYVKRLREAGVNNPLPWEVAREAADYIEELDSRATEYAALNDRQAAQIAALEAKLATARDCLERYCDDKCNTEYNPCEARKALAALGDPQPASAEVKPMADGWQEFAEWMHRELPSGSIIGDPGWWASRIYRRFIAPTPPQQPRQESEIAAEALEEAANTDECKWRGLTPSDLRALATQKRGQE